MTIYISSLEDMPGVVQRFGVRNLVSILQESHQPPTPAGVPAARHHRCAVHDIVEPLAGGVLVEESHVHQLVDYLESWDEESPLLVHCLAGVSRSTAVALIAHAMRSADPELSVQTLRAAAPYAWPNHRIVALADAIVGFDGALLRAREQMREVGRAKEPGEVAALALP